MKPAGDQSRGASPQVGAVQPNLRSSHQEQVLATCAATQNGNAEAIHQSQGALRTPVSTPASPMNQRFLQVVPCQNCTTLCRAVLQFDCAARDWETCCNALDGDGDRIVVRDMKTSQYKQ